MTLYRHKRKRVVTNSFLDVELASNSL